MMNLKKIGVGSLVLLASAAAMATPASDPGVVAINNLGGTATQYITAAFGVAILVAGGFWGIKMMKKAFGAAK